MGINAAEKDFKILGMIRSKSSGPKYMAHTNKSAIERMKNDFLKRRIFEVFILISFRAIFIHRVI